LRPLVNEKPTREKREKRWQKGFTAVPPSAPWLGACLTFQWHTANAQETPTLRPLTVLSKFQPPIAPFAEHSPAGVGKRNTPAHKPPRGPELLPATRRPIAPLPRPDTFVNVLRDRKRGRNCSARGTTTPQRPQITRALEPSSEFGEVPPALPWQSCPIPHPQLLWPWATFVLSPPQAKPGTPIMKTLRVSSQ